MNALEIELSHLPKLLDEEVRRLAWQHYHWDMLQDCAEVFDLDVEHLNFPLDAMPELILRKSNEHLSRRKPSNVFGHACRSNSRSC